MSMDKYHAWQTVSLALKELKDQEGLLRRELCEELFAQNVGKKKAVFEADGYRVTATPKSSVKFDEDVLQSLYVDFNDVEKATIKFKASLVKAKYDKLPEDSMVHECLTEKPGMPTLKLEEIKE